MRGMDEFIVEETTTTDGGNAVAAILDQAGIERIFALTGGHISPVLEACKELGIGIVTTRHEQNSGFMAIAWGMLNRQPGVCAVTAGPGHTNAYSALTQAYEGGFPLLSLSGSYELVAEGKGALQEVDQVAMVEEIAAWADRPADETTLMTATEHALTLAQQKRTHTHLSLPRDVLSREVAVETSKVNPLEIDDENQEEMSLKQSHEIVGGLVNAEQPVIIAGNGIWVDECADTLREFVELSGVPLFTHEMARGTVPDSHDLCFGTPLYRLTGASRHISDSDYVILLDVDIDWRLDYGENPAVPDPEQATVVHVSPAKALERTNDAHRSIQSSAAPALNSLLTASTDVDWPAYNAWQSRLADANRDFTDQFADEMSSDEVPIHPGRLCQEVSDAIDDDTRIVFDGGNIGKWAKFAISAEQPGRWLRLKGPFACIGYGLATANAVQMYAPDDDVVLVTGDGSLGLNVMEFETAARYDLPITCIVANNGSWGSVGGNESPAGTSLPETPFHELARDLGGDGELITDPADLVPAIRRGMDAQIPYCLNIRAGSDYAPVAYPKTLQGY